VFDFSRLQRRLVVFISISFGIVSGLAGSQPAASATAVLQSVQT